MKVYPVNCLKTIYTYDYIYHTVEQQTNKTLSQYGTKQDMMVYFSVRQKHKDNIAVKDITGQGNISYRGTIDQLDNIAVYDKQNK